MTSTLHAGAAIRDITPPMPQFLFGYPHVPRVSTGVHDPLLCGALCLKQGTECLLWLANDIIFIPKTMAAEVRRRIAAATELLPRQIMITATHTHSGPKTLDFLSNEADPVVPPTDPAYLDFMTRQLVEAGVAAWQSAEPAEAGLAVDDGRGIGTNRRDPAGPADPEVPVLMVRARNDRRPLACMVVTSMHPTVLHEDSTLISGDFPGMTRQYLQSEHLGAACPVLYHTGPSGNQSPRHSIPANTFEAARDMGEELGRRIARVLPSIEYRSDLPLDSRQASVELDLRQFPSPDEAQARLDQVRQHLETLRRDGAPRQQVRTAECDWFGAEENVVLARAARDGRLDHFHRACMPAEIHITSVGPWTFVGWQGEIFVEYALALKQNRPGLFVISLANGELQGYLVTAEAAAEGGYEASNSFYAHTGGDRLLQATIALIERGKPLSARSN